MTYKEAIREFQNEYAYLYVTHADFWTAQGCWSAYTDALCKNGTITQHQWNTWSTPFPYAKPLKPTKRILEMEVYNFSH